VAKKRKKNSAACSLAFGCSHTAVLPRRRREKLAGFEMPRQRQFVAR